MAPKAGVRPLQPARYILASSNAAPEVVEYPDSGKVAVGSRLESQRGARLWSVHRLDDAVDYFDGEEPTAALDTDATV